LGDKVIPWPTSLSQIIPGAIVDNLTSFGGKMKGDHHTPATEFLKWGAAGSSGTVIEPFAVQAKFAHPMIMVHYVRGCSLAESYYQSVYGPFQLLIVGDALCQPWAKPVAFEISGLEAGSTAKGIVRLTMSPADEARVDHYEVFLDGVRSQAMPKTGQMSFDAAHISDGYHELRVVAVAKGPLEHQSRQVIPFFVNNLGHSVSLELAQSEIAPQEDIVATVRGPADVEIAIEQHGRQLGKPARDGETIRFRASQLGAGISQLTAVAVVQEKSIRSQPVPVTVR
jgi:hypothetical protein